MHHEPRVVVFIDCLMFTSIRADQIHRDLPVLAPSPSWRIRIRVAVFDIEFAFLPSTCHHPPFLLNLSPQDSSKHLLLTQKSHTVTVW